MHPISTFLVYILTSCTHTIGNTHTKPILPNRYILHTRYT